MSSFLISSDFSVQGIMEYSVVFNIFNVLKGTYELGR
jgi:hypothetical protein